jgi:PPOX class probable F420-dependent enzyme
MRIIAMELTASLPDDRRLRVETRLHTNLMAWLTTANPAGRPDSVPVWFLMCDDDHILVYSQPGRAKLRNIAAKHHVALGLAVTGIIRIDGTAVTAADHPPADRVAEYAEKYTERIGAIFGTVERFAEAFSEAIVITPSRLHASVAAKLRGWVRVKRLS